MINIKLEETSYSYIIKATGHAMYAEYGKDIVCASVSTALIMTANLLARYQEGYNILKVVAKEGNFHMEVTKDSFVDVIYENLKDTFRQLVEQYPNNVKLES